MSAFEIGTLIVVLLLMFGILVPSAFPYVEGWGQPRRSGSGSVKQVGHVEVAYFSRGGDMVGELNFATMRVATILLDGGREAPWDGNDPVLLTEGQDVRCQYYEGRFTKRLYLTSVVHADASSPAA